MDKSLKEELKIKIPKCEAIYWCTATKNWFHNLVTPEIDRINKLIDESEVAYYNSDGELKFTWSQWRTHEALLIGKRKIVKEACEHTNVSIIGQQIFCQICLKDIKPKNGWELA